MVSVRELICEYPGGVRALSGVSLDVLEGERVALIGSNGAGKSTLLLALLGAAPVSSGSIYIAGTQLTAKSAPEIRKIAGLLFQNPDDQLFSARVRDEVAFGLQRSGFTDKEAGERTDAALARLGIAHLAERMPHRLSGGEKRSVALACCVAAEQNLLLLDEPGSFLDPRGRRGLIKLLSELPQTQLIATHDLDMARALCGRTIALKKGCVAADGPTDKILADGELLEACGL